MGLREIGLLAILGIGALLLFLVFRKKNKRSDIADELEKGMPPQWKSLLAKHVRFYRSLDAVGKKQFENDVREFLSEVTITGVETEVEDIDRVLIAASAVIPVFGFPEWKYHMLDEVLLYPGNFDYDFARKGDDRYIQGMVGTGYLNGKMILSRDALRLGFSNKTDKKNVGIHEFVHLVDKADGKIDGIPKQLLEHQYSIPWFDLIRQKMKEIHEGDSDINPYGGTSEVEFFTVASEYFFERPKLLQRKHPELYAMLEKVFDQDMAKQFKRKTKKTS